MVKFPFSPATSASYSVLLLVTRKSRQTMHLISSLFGERSIMPASLAHLLDDSSVYIVHWGYSLAPWHITLGNSAMKSVTTCPLMVVCEWYCMSNSLNSIAHNAIRSAASALLIARYRGLSVRTITVWAWKYGLSLRAAITKVKTSFSIGGIFPLCLRVLDLCSTQAFVPCLLPWLRLRWQPSRILLSRGTVLP